MACNELQVSMPELTGALTDTQQRDKNDDVSEYRRFSPGRCTAQ